MEPVPITVGLLAFIEGLNGGANSLDLTPLILSQ